MTIRECLTTLLLEIKEIIGFEFESNPYSPIAQRWEIKAVSANDGKDSITLGLVYFVTQGIKLSLHCYTACPENDLAVILNLPIDGVDKDDSVDEREFIKFKHIVMQVVLTGKLIMGQIEYPWVAKTINITKIVVAPKPIAESDLGIGSVLMDEKRRIELLKRRIKRQSIRK